MAMRTKAWSSACLALTAAHSLLAQAGGKASAPPPAERAGMTAGDAILAVDGHPAPGLGIAGIRALLCIPGMTYRLTVVRGGDTLAIALATERRI